MGARVEARIEVRTTAAEKARILRAADRRGVSLSDWIRRRLAEAAEAELGLEEPAAPSEEAIADALKARGALAGSGLRRRIERARRTPWTVSR